MTVYERSQAGSLDDQVAARLLAERVIVVGSEITDEVANSVCAQLLLLADEGSRDISLYLNSPGGSISAALAIFDTMDFIGNDVSTHAMGLAASTAQFLLSAGTRGKRFALPRARIVMCQPSGGLGGTATDIGIQAESMRHIKRTMQELMAEHSGHTVEEIGQDIDRDRWFTAAQALEYGLIDHVQGRV